MPLRPDLPPGLNLSRRTTTPVKLPKMTFPMIGGVPESVPAAPAQLRHEVPPGAVEGTVPMPEEGTAMEETRQNRAPQIQMPRATQPQQAEPLPAAQSGRVIIYGRAGCQAAMDAIQDLIDRQVSFTYVDVMRDQQAMQHLQAICNGQPTVPVIIQIGFMGAT